MLVAEAVGQRAGAAGYAARLRADRQRQLRRHQRAGGRRRSVRRGAPRRRRDLDGRRLRPGQRRVGVCSVHQGPGLTNTLTGLTEAAKSRTPLLVLAADTAAAAIRSNFRIAQDQLVAVGRRRRRTTPRPADGRRRRAARAGAARSAERRPVVLMLPLDIQAWPARTDVEAPAASRPSLRPARPARASIDEAADALVRAPPAADHRRSRRAQRGRAREPLEQLAEMLGGLLATSAVANGLFAGNPLGARHLGRLCLADRRRADRPRPTSCSARARRSTCGPRAMDAC